MKEVDELIERLNSAYTPESIFRRDLNSVIQRHAKEGQNWSILSSDIADGLSELGYVKVVRCGECKAWCLDVDQSNMVDDDGKDRRYCLISTRYMRVDDYCSEGERVEKEMSNEDDNL